MFQELVFHTQQIIKVTSTQDLDPRTLTNNDHPSVLHLKCTQLTQVNYRHTPSIGNLWDFSVILIVVPTPIGSLFPFGTFGFVLPKTMMSRKTMKSKQDKTMKSKKNRTIKSSNFCLPHEQEYSKRRKRLFSS